MRYTDQRRNARIQCGNGDLIRSLCRSGAMLEIDEQSIEARRLHQARDLDAANSAHAYADAQLSLHQAIFGMVRGYWHGITRGTEFRVC